MSSIDSMALGCSLSARVIYLSRGSDTRINDFKLTIYSKNGVSPKKITPNLNEPEINAGSKITVTCKWDDPYEALCTTDEAAQIDAAADHNNWKITWKGAEWLIKPPPSAKLEEGFNVSFLFSNLVSTTLEHTGFLYVTAQGIPGYTGDVPTVCPIEKKYPVRIEYFNATPAPYVERGESCTLSWKVQCATKCCVCDEQYGTFGSCVKKVLSPHERYALYAGDQYNTLEPRFVDVYLSNWKELGAIPDEALPIKREPSPHNDRLFYRQNRYYAFLDGKLYESQNFEQGEWRVLSGPKLSEQERSFHAPLLTRDAFLVVGDRHVYTYSFSGQSWTTTEVSLATSSRSVCRCALLDELLVYTALSGNTKLLFAVCESDGKSWSFEYFFEPKKLIPELELVRTVDVITYHGEIYAAVSGTDSSELYIFYTRNLEDWRIFSTVEDVEGWFQLLVCRNRLFLLSSKGIIDLNGGELYSFFPDFPTQEDAKIRTCCTDKICYVIAAGEPEHSHRLFRFRP